MFIPPNIARLVLIHPHLNFPKKDGQVEIVQRYFESCRSFLKWWNIQSMISTYALKSNPEKSYRMGPPNYKLVYKPWNDPHELVRKISTINHCFFSHKNKPTVHAIENGGPILYNNMPWEGSLDDFPWRPSMAGWLFSSFRLDMEKYRSEATKNKTYEPILIITLLFIIINLCAYYIYNIMISISDQITIATYVNDMLSYTIIIYN